MRKELIAVFGAATLLVPCLYAQDADPFERSDAGMTVYFGLAPAGAADAMGPMHGRPAEGIGLQHVMVAVFDSTTGARVTDATVSAYLAGVGRAHSERPLEPMATGGAITYGNYFPMPGAGPYEVRVDVRRPGQARVAHVSFVAAPDSRAVPH